MSFPPGDADAATSGAPRSRADDREVPLISIVIPCHNQESFIVEAVESALSQGYPCKEVIVVDDASTDGSLDRIAALGDAVRLVRSPARRGSGAARNSGLRVSSGVFVQFLDADDVLLPSALEDRYEVFEGHPDADIVYGIQRQVRAASMGKPSLRSNRPLCDSEAGLMKFYGGLDDRGTIVHSLKERLQASCYLFRRTALDRYGPFNEDLRTNEDNEIAFRHAVQGARMRFCATVTNLYRQHEAADRMTRARQYHVYCYEALVAMATLLGKLGVNDEAVRTSLAEEAWRYTWDAVEAGDDSTARALLDLARGLSSRTFGPRWMRMLSKVVSPILLEKLVLRAWPRHHGPPPVGPARAPAVN